MKMIEVTTPSLAKEFLQLAVRLYKKEKNWIRPLDKDIEEVFTEKKNKFFRHGECIRWVLQDESGKTIGRIAAFVDRKTMKQKDSQGQELVVGGLGFFECIDDQESAFKLFDKAKEWLLSKDCNVMEGPINFGERDNWWGLLAEGFDLEPNYKMPYTQPYYLNFFDNYGFEVYFKQLTFGRDAQAPMNPIYQAKAERIERDPKYSFAYLDFKQLDKFTEDFRTVYNKAWGSHSGVKGMSSLQAKTLMKTMKPLMDPKVMYFAYYDGEPIGFFIILPEVNQVFRHVNGHLGLYGKMVFMYYKLFHKFDKIVGRAFGIIPDHQGKGVEGAIINFSRTVVQGSIKDRYKYFEMNWIGDFNKPMIKLCGDIGKVVKVHHTYRKMLDQNLIFERCPDIKH